MRAFQNLPIAVKVLIPPAVLVLALAVVSLAALYGLNFQRETLSEINDIALDKITRVQEFVALSEQVQADVFRISVLRFMDLPEDEIQPIQERMERGLNDLDVIYGRIQRDWRLDAEEQAIIGQMKDPLDAFRQQARQAVAVASENPSFGVVLVRATAAPFAEFRGALTKFLDYQKAKIVRAEGEAARRAKTVSNVIIALAVGITLAGIVATVLISNRLIAWPIGAMTDLMGRLADGDLSVEVAGLERRDEIGGMAQAVEIFRQNAIARAQAEAALRESERILNATGKMGKIGGWEHDLASGGALWTQALHDIIEIPYDERPPGVEEHLDYYPPDNREILAEAYNQAIEHGTPFDLELQVHTATGKLIWCRAQGEPVYEHGECTAMRGTFQDITERRQAEEALRESERLLAKIAANYPNSYLSIIEKDLTIGFTSGQEFEKQNLDPQSFVGLSLDQVFGEHTPTVREHYLKAFQGKETSFELFFNNQHQLYKVVPLQDKNGQITRILAVVENITERVQAEEALRESQRQLSTLMSNLPGMAYRCSNEPGWPMDFVSEGCLALTGYTAAELTDADRILYGDLIHPEDRQMVWDTVQNAVRRGEPFVIEYRLRHRQGGESWVWEQGRLVDAGDGGSAILEGFISDITERKQAEEALRASNARLAETLEELQAAQERMVHQERLAAVGQLVVGVAHNFNTLFTSVVLQAQMALRSGGLPPKVRQRLEVILQQTREAANLVEKLVDFGRRAMLRREQVDLSHLLQQTRPDLEGMLPETVRMEMTWVSGEYLAHADPARLQQAILNLATNAREAMPDGGELHVGLARVAVADGRQCAGCGETFAGEWLQIAIRDTGTGISPDVLPHIFEPFFTTRTPEGSGLGLAQVFGIMEQHEGHIEVETQADEWTEFSLFLPIASASSPEK